MSIVQLQSVRLAFPDLFEPRQFEGHGPFSYRASFLQPEMQPVLLQQADNAWQSTTMGKVIAAVAASAWKEEAEKTLKALGTNPQKICWYDGAQKNYDGYDGHFVLSASRGEDKGRPMVLDRDMSDLTVRDGKPYAGCYVNAAIEIWAQDNRYGRGIRATLHGVQFVKDGDAFTAGVRLRGKVFEDLGVPQTGDDLL